MSERVDRAERLLNLVFALMSTARAVPRSVIREQVPGYGEAGSEASFERMFERDKDELRSMGIPIETVVDDFGEVQGYRIVRESYAMPPMELTLEERSAIVVAAQVWSHAQVAPLAGTAVRKLQSVSVDPRTWVPSDLAGEVQITTSDAALLPLMSAIRSGVVVTFDYRVPSSDEPGRRTVSPWRLTTREGRWMLVGFDHDREDLRTFRVSRIQGSVTLTSRQRRAPEEGEVSVGATEHAGFAARVRVEPGQGAALRRVASPADTGWSADEFDVEVASPEAFVSLVCSAAGHATVLGPPEAVAAVGEAWQALARSHGGGQS